MTLEEFIEKLKETRGMRWCISPSQGVIAVRPSPVLTPIEAVSESSRLCLDDTIAINQATWGPWTKWGQKAPSTLRARILDAVGLEEREGGGE